MVTGSLGQLGLFVICSGLLGFTSPAFADGAKAAGPVDPHAASVQHAAPRVAPDAPTEPDGYRTLVDEALHEYDLGNYAEARSLFARAHRLFPNARTHRGLGKTEFELRNYEASITNLEAALQSQVRPLDERLRVETEQLLSRARAFVGSLVIETKPAATELRIDDQLVPHTGGPISLSVGEHLIDAQAPGYASERRRVQITGEQPEHITIVFSRPLAPAPPPAPQARWYKNPWLWTAIGVVAAGAAAGTAVAVTRDGDDHAPYDRGTTETLGKAP